MRTDTAAQCAVEGLGLGNNIPVGMKPGRRELNEASVSVCLSEAVPQSMRPHVRELLNLYVPPEARHKRLATVLLNLVCQEADANGITLLLTARPQDDQGPSEEKLIEWYARFGFKGLQDTPNGLMLARQVSAPHQVVSEIARARINRAVRTGVLIHQDVH